jgi:hypothetical protein
VRHWSRFETQTPTRRAWEKGTERLLLLQPAQQPRRPQRRTEPQISAHSPFVCPPFPLVHPISGWMGRMVQPPSRDVLSIRSCARLCSSGSHALIGAHCATGTVGRAACCDCSGRPHPSSTHPHRCVVHCRPLPAAPSLLSVHSSPLSRCDWLSGGFVLVPDISALAQMQTHENKRQTHEFKSRI